VDNAFHIFNMRSDVRAKLAPGISGVVGLDGWGGLYQVDVLVPPIPPEGQVGGPAFGSPLRRLRANGNVYRPAAYALIDIALLERIKLVPGVRVDYASDGHRWSVDPRLTARADLTGGFPRTTLKGAAGSFHQPPQPQESLAPFGTPEVRPNRSVHLSVGIEQELARDVEISVEGFHKRFSDLVTASTSATLSGNTFGNQGSGRAYGSEILLRWRPGGRFFGWVAYTLSRSERRSSPAAPLELFQFDQTHILNVVGSYALGRGWTAGARFRLVSGELYTPYLGGVLDLDAGAYAPIASPSVNSARLGTFHSLDVRIDKTWTFSAWKLSAYADVRNVYNHRNAEAVSYNYNYTQTQTVAGFPILPIVGLRGEL
jgi:outer membrane receptor protein involved in Fe transport